MNSNLEACWSFTSCVEGGYSSSRFDPGNWTGGIVGAGRLVGTNHGISAPLLATWLGAARASMVTAAFMQKLSVDTARAIFTARFWNALIGNQLQNGVDLMVVDFGFNAGDSASASILESLVGTAVDGCIGPETLAAEAQCASASLISRLRFAQEQHYRECDDFALYGNDWLARTAARAALASRLSGHSPSAVSARSLVDNWKPVPRPVHRPRHPDKIGVHL